MEKQAQSPVSVMRRVEMKYLLDARQTTFLRRSLEGHMAEDAFGLTTIASLYYDTPNYRLVRASLEKPEFKEKLRLRAYGRADDRSPVYLELKRKAGGVVYKRRVQTTLPRAEAFFRGEGELCEPGQIRREIEAFRRYYGELRPACVILYERTAYFQPEGDLRLTIDRNPRYRMEDLDLTAPPEGTPLLSPGSTILEIKVQGAMPLWLSSILSRGGICKTSFSKYGEAYSRMVRGEKELLRAS